MSVVAGANSESGGRTGGAAAGSSSFEAGASGEPEGCTAPTSIQVRCAVAEPERGTTPIQQCIQKPTRVTDERYIKEVFADAGGVYWANDDNELRALENGQSAPTTLFASQQGSIGSIVGNDQSLFFLVWDSEGESSSIHEFSRMNGAHRKLDSDLPPTTQLAVQGESLYLANVPGPGDLSVSVISGVGPAPRRIAEGAITRLTQDEKHLYWATEKGALQRLELPGGPPETLTSGQVRLLDLRVSNSEVFAISDSGVLAVSTSGECAKALVLPPWNLDLGGLAVDDEFVYFGAVMASDLLHSSIWRTPRAGGSAVQITPMSAETGSGSPAPLAISGRRLFWRTQQGLETLSLSREP